MADQWAEGIHPDLLAAKLRVYDPSGLSCSPPGPEAESQEYGAYEFTVDHRAVRFRVAKTTSKKVGQFVTLWKRSEQGPIEPCAAEDPIDLVVISVRDDHQYGQFVFPREVLRTRDVLSHHGSGGKRAIRVYPPWSTPTSTQAGNTQRWQLEHFLPIGDASPIDTARARALYHA
ncbi:MepB family protein [Nocardia sp. MW-W600-9]